MSHSPFPLSPYKSKGNVRFLIATNFLLSEMLLSSLTALIAVLPIAVLGGQLHAYNKFHRRASPSTIELNARRSVANDTPIEPGTLRYVENTGICGRIPLLMLSPAYLLIMRQKPPPVCTRLQDMRASKKERTIFFGTLLPATTLTRPR